MLAVATPPAPLSVAVTADVVLAFVPGVVPVTFTEKVQDPAAASVAPVRLIVPLPATARIVPASQDPLRPFGVATTSPAGRVSVKPTLLTAIVFGFVIVKLRALVPLRATL